MDGIRAFLDQLNQIGIRDENGQVVSGDSADPCAVELPRRLTLAIEDMTEERRAALDDPTHNPGWPMDLRACMESFAKAIYGADFHWDSKDWGANLTSLYFPTDLTISSGASHLVEPWGLHFVRIANSAIPGGSFACSHSGTVSDWVTMKLHHAPSVHATLQPCSPFAAALDEVPDSSEVAFAAVRTVSTRADFTLDRTA